MVGSEILSEKRDIQNSVAVKAPESLVQEGAVGKLREQWGTLI